MLLLLLLVVVVGLSGCHGGHGLRRVERPFVDWGEGDGASGRNWRHSGVGLASRRLLGWLLRLLLLLLLWGIVTVDGTSLLVQLWLLLLLAIRGRHVGNLLLDIWLLLHGRRWRQLALLVTTASGHRSRRRRLWSSGSVQMMQLLRGVGPIHVQILHASREVADGRSVDRRRGRI